MPKQRKRGIKGAGSVYRRQSDGRWVGSFTVEETGKRKDIYADTEKEAWEKLQQAQMEQKQGILATGPKQKLGPFLTQWLNEVHCPPLIRPSTHERYLSTAKTHILPTLGHFELQKVTPQRLHALYTAKRKEGLSSGSITLIHAILSMAFDTAIKWRMLTYNPCKGIAIPHEAKREALSLTEEQAKHLLEQVRGRSLEPFIVLALSTGMRIGELLALRWSDINLEQGSVEVHRTVSYLRKQFYEREPKTKSGKRKILIPSEVCTILQAHKRQQGMLREQRGVTWQALNLVFCTKVGGFIQSKSQERRFYQLLEEIHLPKIHVHDLRHSAATLLGAMGVSPKVIQEMLGHSSLDITLNIYSHVLPSMQKEARDKMQAMFLELDKPQKKEEDEQGKEEGQHKEKEG